MVAWAGRSDAGRAQVPGEQSLPVLPQPPPPALQPFLLLHGASSILSVTHDIVLIFFFFSFFLFLSIVFQPWQGFTNTLPEMYSSLLSGYDVHYQPPNKIHR